MFKINAEQESLYFLMSKTDKKFYIPGIHKPYAWTEKQCKKLLRDLQQAYYTNTDLFLGSMLFVDNKGENTFEVVDGQQRLITLSLLFKVLLEWDYSHKPLNDALYITGRRAREKTTPKISSGEIFSNDNEHFKGIIFAEDIDDIKEGNTFKKNFEYLYNWVKLFSANTYTGGFSDFILDRVHILSMKVTDDSISKARKSALNIFETLTGESINLTAVDMIKARLYSNALNNLQHKEFVKLWEDLDKKCQVQGTSLNTLFEIYKGETNKTVREYFIDDKGNPLLYEPKKWREVMGDLENILKGLENGEQ